MEWLEPSHLMVVLVAVALVAALCLHTASVVAEARRRRSRRVFALGFSAGWMAARIFGGRRPLGLRALANHAKRARPLGLARPSR